MNVIRAAHYADTIAALRRDPVVLGMAHGVRDIPRDQLAHPDGGPRFEFMQSANHTYRQRGGKFNGPKHLGAVAEAVLSLLDNPLTVEERYLDLTNSELERLAQRLEQQKQKDGVSAEDLQTIQEMQDEITQELERRRSA